MIARYEVTKDSGEDYDANNCLLELAGALFCEMVLREPQKRLVFRVIHTALTR
jgi:hypothetical protein